MQLFLDGQLTDRSVSEGEAELKVDPSSGKVALQVVHSDVAVRFNLGRTGHLDGVRELARRPRQPLADLLSSPICLALVSHGGVGYVALDGDIDITSHVRLEITRDDRRQFTGVNALWLLHHLHFLRGNAGLLGLCRPPWSLPQGESQGSSRRGCDSRTGLDSFVRGAQTDGRVWRVGDRGVLPHHAPEHQDPSPVPRSGAARAGNRRPHTGYRYYSVDQVPTAQVIHRFRELGMPVREVGELVAITDPHARAAIISQHLQRVETQLDQTRAAVVSLRRLLEPNPAPLEVLRRRTEATTVAAVRDVVNLGDVLGWYDAAMSELEAVLSSVSAVPIGPPGGLYDNELFTEERGMMVVYIPVDD